MMGIYAVVALAAIVYHGTDGYLVSRDGSF